MTAGRVFGLFAIVAAIAYPALVYVGLTRWSSQVVAGIVVGLAAITVLAKLLDPEKRAQLREVLVVPILVVSFAAASAVFNSHLFLLLTPVLISIALLITFAVTLRPGSTPMIERFARLQDPDLTPDKVLWCRRYTIVWCGFFVANGLCAALLASWAPLSWWALYTGLLAYVLMGLLFGGELVLRKIRFGWQT